MRKIKKIIVKKSNSSNNINSKLYYSNKIIASKIVYCNNFWSKGTGLMLHSKNSVNNTAWVFTFNTPRRIGVTMFLVFFPIDVIFLDEHDMIIELKENLKPFTNYYTKNNVSKFIELDAGTIKKYTLSVGKKLFFRR